jgi:hypothetical protein
MMASSRSWLLAATIQALLPSCMHFDTWMRPAAHSFGTLIPRAGELPPSHPDSQIGDATLRQTLFVYQPDATDIGLTG